MRAPRASSVVVALTTFAAVAIVATVVSQLTPVDRAGAVLPITPITAPDAEIPTLGGESGPSVEPSPGTAGTDSESDSGGTSAPTVVTPAAPETVGPAPEPDPEPPAPPASGSPGNSANAPGQGGTNPGNGAANGNADRP